METAKIIKQPYHLTVSQSSYNVHEERVLLAIINELQPHFSYKTSFKEFLEKFEKNEKDVVIKVKVKSLMRDGSKKYREVEKALEGIRSKKVKIIGKDKTYGEYSFCSSFILEYAYFFSKEMVKIKLSTEVMSYLCASLSNYTKFNLKIAFNCSSPYTIKLYKYISHFRDRIGKCINLSIQQLREWLCLNEKYERPNSIRQKILLPAQKELKEKADIWFELKDPIKEVRKVTGWKIKIFGNTGTSNPTLLLKEGKEKLSGEQKKSQLDKLKSKFKLSEPLAKDIVAKVPKDGIYQTLYDVECFVYKKEIDIGAYTASLFYNRYPILKKK